MVKNEFCSLHRCVNYKTIEADERIKSQELPLYFWTFQREFGNMKSATVNYTLNMSVPSSLEGVGNKEIIVKRDHWEKSNTWQYQ